MKRIFHFFYTDNVNNKSHYVKTTAKAGEVFRLLAVFEDGSQSTNNNYSSTKKDNLNSIGREKEKGRYVQLMSESRQVVENKIFSYSHLNIKTHLNYVDYLCGSIDKGKIL